MRDEGGGRERERGGERERKKEKEALNTVLLVRSTV